MLDREWSTKEPAGYWFFLQFCFQPSHSNSSLLHGLVPTLYVPFRLAWIGCITSQILSFQKHTRQLSFLIIAHAWYIINLPYVSSKNELWTPKGSQFSRMLNQSRLLELWHFWSGIICRDEGPGRLSETTVPGSSRSGWSFKNLCDSDHVL